MKLITHLYAIVICSILSSVVIAFLAISFPFTVIAEVITFIQEVISDDKFEHGSWLNLCKDCFIYIKNIYCLIINSHYKD